MDDFGPGCAFVDDAFVATGPITLDLRRRYRELHDDPDYATAIDYGSGG